MKKIFHTKYGIFAVNTSTDAKMASALEENKYNQEEDIVFLSKLINKDSVVVDIGAHIGTMSVPFAKLAKQVIAFEPAAETALFLKENVVLNTLENVEVREMALGREKSRASISPIHTSNAGGNSLQEGDDFPVETLDSQVDFASFIKIDVEGLEPDVLEGATKLLQKYHPILYFEINLFQLQKHHTRPLRKIANILNLNGYSIYLPVGNQLCRVRSLALVSLAMEPRSYLFSGPSGTFDLLAMSKKPDMPIIKFSTLFLITKVIRKLFI